MHDFQTTRGSENTQACARTIGKTSLARIVFPRQVGDNLQLRFAQTAVEKFHHSRCWRAFRWHEEGQTRA